MRNNYYYEYRKNPEARKSVNHNQPKANSISEKVETSLFHYKEKQGILLQALIFTN